jgi:hypothetical protein
MAPYVAQGEALWAYPTTRAAPSRVPHGADRADQSPLNSRKAWETALGE